MDRHYTRAGLDPNGGVNSPDEFDKLTDQEKAEVLTAIREIIAPGPRVLNHYTTYSIKHFLPMYISNGAMKGACIAAGFNVEDKQKINWSLYAAFTEEGSRRAAKGRA